MTALFTDGFEAGVAAWVPFSATFTSDATHVHTGSEAAKLVVTGSPTSAGARTAAVPAVAGELYTLSMWAFATGSTSNVQATIGFQDASNASLVDSVTTVTLTANTWTHIVVSAAAAPDGTAFATFGPTLTTSPTTGKTIWVDDVEFDGPGLTATVDENWPPRIQVVATGFLATDTVTIARSAGGVRVPVRGADEVVVGDTSLVRNDAENSFGAPITYVLVLNGNDAVTTPPLTPTLPGGNVALSDAITGLAVETQVFAWPDHENDRVGTMYTPNGQSVFVGAPRGGSTNQVKLATMTDSSRDQMIALLNGATSSIVLLRVPDVTVFPGYDGHYVITADDEQPWTQRGSDQRRFFTLTAVETGPWAPGLLATASTLADIEDAYSGGALADIESAFSGGQLLDLEVRDWHNEGAL